MKPKQVKSIDGFTNSSNFYVEDVTEKWGASSLDGYIGYGGYEDDLMVPLEGLGNPSGSAADAVLDAASDAKDAVAGTLDNPVVKAGLVAGQGPAGAATGGAVVGITKAIADSDLTTTQQVTVVGVATTAAIALGLGAMAILPTGLAKGA